MIPRNNPYKITDFNSIKVRLELLEKVTKEEKNTNFNSIKVRLEPPPKMMMQGDMIFQFHKGTIRTEGDNLFFLHVHYFNSIKVRLEHFFAL